MRPFLRFFPLCFFVLLTSVVQAEDREFCVYINEAGKIVQVNGRALIPAHLQASAKCFSPVEKTKENYLAKPEEVELKGNLRRQMMASSLGRINLRWPRSAEVLFGRTPERAMADAATTASRALKKGGFPSRVSGLSIEWNIVFMDESVPDSQVPMSLINNCHPGWMTPPSNIYVVAQRVAAGCDGGDARARVNTKVADGELAKVLLHEIGHAVEFHLLGKNAKNDRMRAEGFASWFEQYAAELSSVIPRGSTRQYYTQLAKYSFQQNPGSFQFRGSAFDYARASMFFTAIVDRRGLKGLADVYDEMAKNRSDFFPAIQKRIGWNGQRLMQEVEKTIASSQ